MKHNFRSGVVIAAVVITLTACSNDPANPGEAGGTFSTATVNVDGREVPCITWKAGYAGGLSCDWATR